MQKTTGIIKKYLPGITIPSMILGRYYRQKNIQKKLETTRTHLKDNSKDFWYFFTTLVWTTSHVDQSHSCQVLVDFTTFPKLH